jgi:hypothetical protein
MVVELPPHEAYAEYLTKRGANFESYGHVSVL